MGVHAAHLCQGRRGREDPYAANVGGQLRRPYREAGMVGPSSAAGTHHQTSGGFRPASRRPVRPTPNSPDLDRISWPSRGGTCVVDPLTHVHDRSRILDQDPSVDVHRLRLSEIGRRMHRTPAIGYDHRRWHRIARAGPVNVPANLPRALACRGVLSPPRYRFVAASSRPGHNQPSGDR